MCVFIRRMERLTDCVRIIQGKRFLVEFFQVFMDTGSVHIERCTGLETVLVMIICDRIYLGEHIEYVKPESVHAFIQPEIQNIDDLFSDFRIFPVQISLFLAEQM